MTDRELDRDAGSGKFVSDEYADENPGTTVHEHIAASGRPNHDQTIGKVVHYVSYGTPKGEYTSECRAAVITAVSDEDSNVVSLCILNPTGQFFNENVKFDNFRNGGTWHYVV